MRFTPRPAGGSGRCRSWTIWRKPVIRPRTTAGVSIARGSVAGLAITALTGALLAGAALGICLRPPPGHNPAVFEGSPLIPGVAALDEAITLGLARDPDGVLTPVLVLGFEGQAAAGEAQGRETVRGKAVPASISGGETELMTLMTRAQPGALRALADDPSQPVRSWALSAFLPTGRGERQIAAGTNFPEHAEEVAVAQPFQFPKFGPATPALATVAAAPAMLLDYEGELCLRFDRPVSSPETFEAALKGIFLCGDFTDRAVLTRLVRPGDVGSGIGFSDAKSGPDLFPTGPFLVFPRDWRAFVAAERFTTAVDGSPRQDARGRQMSLAFDALAARAVTDGDAPRWLHRGAPAQLAPGGVIAEGAALMSGTPAGVIYRPPDALEIACGIGAYVCLGRFLTGERPVAFVIERYLARLSAAGHFLQPGQTVRHASSRLGAITVHVVPAPTPAPNR
jgi:2-keto-4-pentenoate hydratase/2-oxohepta-3-ene-1,7-dioic acid hydratase in catechol pathway